MSTEPSCPACQAEFTYADGNLWVCPQCGHEWSQHQALSSEGLAPTTETAPQIRDAFGNVLADGDSITVIKELRIKGASSVVKVGTKVKSIRLEDAGDGHDIICKIEGLGTINLKSEFVKKA